LHKGITVAFSETNACGVRLKCNFFQPDVFVIEQIDIQNGVVNVHDLYDGNQYSITFNPLQGPNPGAFRFIISGHVYNARIVQTGTNTYGIQLEDSKFRVFGLTTNVGICYYK